MEVHEEERLCRARLKRMSARVYHEQCVEIEETDAEELGRRCVQRNAREPVRTPVKEPRCHTSVPMRERCHGQMQPTTVQSESMYESLLEKE
jgi:hypothetical protein